MIGYHDRMFVNTFDGTTGDNCIDGDADKELDSADVSIGIKLICRLMTQVPSGFNCKRMVNKGHRLVSGSSIGQVVKRMDTRRLKQSNYDQSIKRKLILELSSF